MHINVNLLMNSPRHRNIEDLVRQNNLGSTHSLILIDTVPIGSSIVNEYRISNSIMSEEI